MACHNVKLPLLRKTGTYPYLFFGIKLIAFIAGHFLIVNDVFVALTAFTELS